MNLRCAICLIDFAAAGALCLSAVSLLGQQPAHANNGAAAAHPNSLATDPGVYYLSPGCPASQQSQPPQAPQSVSTYPTFAAGETTYVVTPCEANLIIDTLYIPSGYTIQAGPGVTSMNWQVTTLKFGTNATIDLSVLQPAPYPPVSVTGAPLPVPYSHAYRAAHGAFGAGPPQQADYCIGGQGGAPGGGGADGAAGVDLTMTGVATVDNDGGQGSLWIRTDGGMGGDGGIGGRGQRGGGRRSGWSLSHPLQGCGAAAGGPGGRGGPHGAGGRVAGVSITFTASPAPVQIDTGTAAVCGNSTRPPAVNGATGRIVVWGAVGCPGVDGPQGPGGLGG